MKPSASVPWVSRIWPRLGAVILAGVCLYYGFGALNTTGLPTRTGSAVVLEKVHVGPGTSYTTIMIGGRPTVRPHETADVYVLKLRLDNRETAALVDKSLYDAVNADDQVQVTFKIARFTKTLNVVQVTAPPKREGRDVSPKRPAGTQQNSESAKGGPAATAHQLRGVSAKRPCLNS